MNLEELCYLHRKVQHIQHDRRRSILQRSIRREVTRLEEERLAAVDALRPNPSLEELRRGRLVCMNSQVELGTLSTSSMVPVCIKNDDICRNNDFLIRNDEFCI